jgi:FkbM family methyltransferase
MKVAVYFVYTGELDRPGAKLPIIPDNPFFDYYFFTNNKDLYQEAKAHPFWKAQWMSEETPDEYSANMACKRLKAMPHTEVILNTYDYTVYLDTKINFGEHNWGVTITEEYIRDILYKTSHMRMVTHLHERLSVDDELRDSLSQSRYVSEEDRIRGYLSEKDNAGLHRDCENFLMTGYIFRKMKDSDVERIGSFWYDEIQKCGIQCQISFHYVYQLYKQYIRVINREPNTHYDFLEIGTSDFDTYTQNYPKKRVISVEPLGEYLDALPEHPGHIKVRSAICDQYEETDQSIYYIPDQAIKANNLAWWLRGCNKVGGYHPKHIGLEHFVRTQPIHMMTIDELFRRYSIKRVDHIKIDTEGYESSILNGLYKKLIKEQKENWPRTIQYEINANSQPDKIIQVTSKFLQMGYKVSDVGEDIVLIL